MEVNEGKESDKIKKERKEGHEKEEDDVERREAICEAGGEAATVKRSRGQSRLLSCISSLSSITGHPPLWSRLRALLEGRVYFMRLISHAGDADDTAPGCPPQEKQSWAQSLSPFALQ
ncbi:hypothetical protein Pmani_029105 [Petrolisthes manimaculis]|uniref:Uncharacterized protein n=1 Tax=Petrolisthes manimaculis TaxID=1843537 RepID=A0AAE1P088_9EUCA|nr:hypothetical protein Pmani_029105 [Petrolisthes manimaculis]